MQETKLTIRISPKLVENAKAFAKENHTTLTRLIEAYLTRLPTKQTLADAPIVDRLSGVLSSDVGLDDYKKHLDEKYGS